MSCLLKWCVWKVCALNSCLNCKFSLSGSWDHRIRDEKKQWSTCFVFRSGSDWNMGSNRGYKSQMLYLVMRENLFTSSFLYFVCLCWYTLQVFVMTAGLASQIYFSVLSNSTCRERTFHRHLDCVKPGFLSLCMWMCHCFCRHALLIAVRRRQFSVCGAKRRSKSLLVIQVNIYRNGTQEKSRGSLCV